MPYTLRGWLLFALGLFVIVFVFFRSKKDKQADILEAKESLKKALQEKCDVLNACNHPELGVIDFIWGNKLGGVCHIALKHKKDLGKIPEILFEGSIRRGKTRVFITYQDFTVVLSNNLFGKPCNHWILTGYKKDADE